MSGYHLNGKGEPGLCKAEKGHCPFASLDHHYRSTDDARLAYEKQRGSSFEPAPEPIKGMLKAAALARTATDEKTLMQIARGGNKRAIKELALNKNASAEVLLEASTKISDLSSERQLLENHPNFPTYGLSEKSLKTALAKDPFNIPNNIHVEDANDVVLLALTASDSWGSNNAGRKAKEILESPSSRISDETIEKAASVSENYARAAASGGRFPTKSLLEKRPLYMEEAGSICYSIKSIKSAQKLEEVWDAMKHSDWSSWTAQEMLANENTPAQLRPALIQKIKTVGENKAASRSTYSSNRSSPYRSSSSDSDSGLLNPINPISPFNPNNWS